ncbi:MAG: methylated-DNA--[protein]-cysteine S-methyltransferase [Candidatus Latescibacteria bacterium]|nr:methylated-DNA--[protein]-cysteine S-methyltransferase [bacterium]MBD3423719.1 methylated-DNA--[protein]-cysteine S-methyltransferase [Candidatus Latescibacterota bacterium]
MHRRYYHLIKTGFGGVGISWKPGEAGGIIERVFIPDPASSAKEKLLSSFPDSRPGRDKAISVTADKIAAFMEGQDVSFGTGILDMGNCSEFQRRVLMAEREIPRGWISTYGRIGRRIGSERGGRAVGRALAGNPFPLIIPCHRTVRAGGLLGGFQGGPGMKRRLLELEGVEVSENGKVLTANIYY